ncbi:ash family protein [Pseudomonas chlororaphis]|nr:ash family protein [Pseudomonas chlororaphis]MBP5072386.1 ash family protein [Pseudomonas chlororaphis]MBP5089029.1 ash family protein [Pseudomonas chlororaphis]MBP5143305.1 ash family protein [Pseudomonas chlororaphis]QTT83695.1 ash family protein [Pseudomonas chlororaphis]
MKEHHYSAPVAAKSAAGCRSPSITPCTSAQLFLGAFCCPVFMAAVRGHASAWPGRVTGLLPRVQLPPSL